MRRVCAWCLTESDPGIFGDDTSDGLCERCAEQLEAGEVVQATRAARIEDAAKRLVNAMVQEGSELPAPLCSLYGRLVHALALSPDEDR